MGTQPADYSGTSIGCLAGVADAADFPAGVRTVFSAVHFPALLVHQPPFGNASGADFVAEYQPQRGLDYLFPEGTTLHRLQPPVSALHPAGRMDCRWRTINFLGDAAIALIRTVLVVNSAEALVTGDRRYQNRPIELSKVHLKSDIVKVAIAAAK